MSESFTRRNATTTPSQRSCANLTGHQGLLLLCKCCLEMLHSIEGQMRSRTAADCVKPVSYGEGNLRQTGVVVPHLHRLQWSALNKWSGLSCMWRCRPVALLKKARLTVPTAELRRGLRLRPSKLALWGLSPTAMRPGVGGTGHVLGGAEVGGAADGARFGPTPVLRWSGPLSEPNPGTELLADGWRDSRPLPRRKRDERHHPRWGRPTLEEGLELPSKTWSRAT